MTLSTKLFRQSENPLLEALLSDENIAYVQSALTQQVLKLTGYVISPQSERDLIGIMNNAYDLYGNTQCTDGLSKSLDQLNAIIVHESTQNVLEGMRSYFQYVRDASQLAVPMDRSVNTTIDKSLEVTSRHFY